jgi:NADH dehydrogenase
MMDHSLRHIVILSGEAAGLELATILGDGIGRRKRARIALVDRSRTHIWKPMLHSIAASSLRRSQHELNYMSQGHWHHFYYRNGEMTGLYRAARTITLAPTVDDEGRESGSATNDFGTPAAKQFAVPLDSLYSY